MQYVTFNIEDYLMGIDILKIMEINKTPDITEVEQTPPYVRGLVNLRGRTVTVLDLPVRLGLMRKPVTEDSHCIILKKDWVGLLVDEIGEVIDVKTEDIEAVPANLEGIDRRFIAGVFNLYRKILIILNADEIIRPEM